jgi:hypothetical protein
MVSAIPSFHGRSCTAIPASTRPELYRNYTMGRGLVGTSVVTEMVSAKIKWLTFR